MTKRVLRIFGLVVFLMAGSVVSVLAQNNDFQYWMIESISWKVANNWKMFLGQEAYFQNDASDFYYEHTEIGADYTGFAKWVDVGLHYRHVLSKTNDIWLREEQPSLNVTLKGVLKNWSFSDRNRFEYRIKEDAEDGWRYRNLVTIKFPWKITRYQIQPYFADEMFADFLKEEINENRLYTGFSFTFTQNIGLDIFYMWRRIKSSGKWQTNDVLGTNLKLTF